jgi:ABC-type phosphate/phosphonate transport system substrate-binding protein
MKTISRRTVLIGIASLPIFSTCVSAFAIEPYGPSNAEITVVVTDPLALPLACSCVQGYAQRKYERLADFLQIKLKKSVRVVWGDSIEKAIREHGVGTKVLFIGKDSVVRYDSRRLNLDVSPMAQLTDANGSVNQRGMFVVRRDNAAASLLDLEGYQVLWGPEKCDEKSSSPKAKLKELEINVSGGETCDTCSIAARKLVEDANNSKMVGVISSYAEKLLTGCGTVEQGALKIVGESEEVPFISVYATERFSSDERKAITDCLLEVKGSKDLLASLESKSGFVLFKTSTR